MFPKGYFRGVAEHTHALRPTVAGYLVPEMNKIASTLKKISKNMNHPATFREQMQSNVQNVRETVSGCRR